MSTEDQAIRAHADAILQAVRAGQDPVERFEFHLRLWEAARAEGLATGNEVGYRALQVAIRELSPEAYREGLLAAVVENGCAGGVVAGMEQTTMWATSPAGHQHTFLFATPEVIW